MLLTVRKMKLQSLALGLAAAAAFALSLPAPSAAQKMSLEERIEQCSPCHGKDGNSTMDNIPSLAGQPAFYILNQVFMMREGVRQVEAMAAIVKDLKDEDLDALSKHYAKLPAKQSSEPVDPELVKRGAELAAKMRCGSCHAATLAGQDQMPRLAKQRIDYLVQSMKDLRENKRSGADGNMIAAIAAATEADLVALAHYAATK
jgi:cytochrome c553